MESYWSYEHVDEIDFKSLMDKVRNLGDDGWELVNFFYNGRFYAILKKQESW